MQEHNRAMRMFKAMDRMRKAWGSLAPSQISKSQMGTLLTLRHGGTDPMKETDRDPFEQMTLSELAAVMGQSMPAVSQRISKLEQMGYVQRIPDEKDKRTTWIRLTESGVDLMERACQGMVKRLDTIMNQLGEEDTDTMFRVLDKLAEIMEQSVDQDTK